MGVRMERVPKFTENSMEIYKIYLRVGEYRTIVPVITGRLNYGTVLDIFVTHMHWNKFGVYNRDQKKYEACNWCEIGFFFVCENSSFCLGYSLKKT